MNITDKIKSWSAHQLAIAIGYGVRHTRRPSLRRFLIDTVFERHFGWRSLEVESKTAFGALMQLSLPDAVQTRIFLTGRWEPTISEIISTSLSAGDIFIDIGANVGYYTLLASQRVGDGGKVYAFEASPSIFRQLQMNVSANRMSNTKLYNVAVSNEPGKVWIWTAPKGNLGHSTIVNSVAAADGHHREAEVPCDVIGALVPLPDLLAARLIKMDIEGAERLAIEGVLPYLDQFSPRTEWVVELSPKFSPGGAKDIGWIFNAFINAGYSAFKIENSYNALSTVIEEPDVRPVVRIKEPPSEPLSDVLFSKRRDHV